MTTQEKVQAIYDAQIGGEATEMEAQLDEIMTEEGLDEDDEETDEEDEDEAAG